MAFATCRSLKYVTIPDSVEIICGNAFNGCVSLQEMHFPNRSLEQIREIPDNSGSTLYYWGLSEDKIIPGIVEDVVLYTTAASPSTWLESTPVFYESTRMFSGFTEKTDAVKVIIPSKVNGTSVISIGTDTFHDCSKLTNVTIPDSVTSIDGSVFENCSSLTSVTIGNGVTSIG